MPTADRAKALLEEVAARYASMTSYSDCGAVHTQRNAVVFDGSTAYTWKQTGTDAPQTELAEDFSLAIAAATGTD